MDIDFEARSRLLDEARAFLRRYAAGDLSRQDLLDHLVQVAIPALSDPTGGDGFIRGTRDVIERAVQNGLLSEDDWDAIVEAAEVHPALLAIVPGE